MYFMLIKGTLFRLLIVVARLASSGIHFCILSMYEQLQNP